VIVDITIFWVFGLLSRVACWKPMETRFTHTLRLLTLLLTVGADTTR